MKSIIRDDLGDRAAHFAVDARMRQNILPDVQWHVLSIKEAEFTPPYIPGIVRAFILHMIRTDGRTVGDIVVVLWDGSKFILIQEPSHARDDHEILKKGK